MAERREHLIEIDHLKGIAILCVVWIHASPFDSTLLFDRIVNRAVPIFVVLWGMTSEMYLQRLEARGLGLRDLAREWLSNRARRLLVPYWAMAAAWWTIVLLEGFPKVAHLGTREFIATFLGYAPWIGTSWFVTVIIQLTLILPFYRWLAVRVGALPSLIVSAAASSLTAFYLWEITEVGRSIFGNDAPHPGWFYQWIFPPRLIWHVTAGMFLVRLWGVRLGRNATLALVGITLVGFVLTGVARGAPEDNFMGTLRQQAVQCLLDVPLALALLGLLQWKPPGGGVGRFLAWCGRWSWGLYLGHLFVYDTALLAGFDPGNWGNPDRVMYGLILLASGSAIAVSVDRLARRLGINQPRRPAAPPPPPPSRAEAS